MPAADPQAPYVRISHDALRVNLEELRAALGKSTPVADLRRDAWGHGAEAVATTLLRSGVDTFVVDAHVAPVELPWNLQTDAALITLDPHALFGLAVGSKRRGTPVMRMFGHVLSLKRLVAGEGVSYGYTHRAPVDTTVALVIGGYAQGIVRALGNRAYVAIDGRHYPVVGRVAMDVCVIDVGAHTSVAPGDDVVFFGDPTLGHPDLSHWCEITGLPAAEMAGVVGQHVSRVHESPSTAGGPR